MDPTEGRRVGPTETTGVQTSPSSLLVSSQRVHRDFHNE